MIKLEKTQETPCSLSSVIEMCHCFCAQVWYLHAVAGFACATEEGVYMGTSLVGPLIIFGATL